ncbi:cathepsin K-like [Genypterus blacodes]|uniref:cathepsin K-like n=1 Tax=Genypterus blacodes TaxID=154954 RepID=UPI003F7746F1
MSTGLLFLFVSGLAAASTKPELDQHWELWKKMHDKVYSHQVEESGRRWIWEEHLEMINLHNLEATLGLHTYELAMNHLGDMTSDEIKNMLMGSHEPTDLDKSTSELPEVNASIPAMVDWRTQGLVTPVKMQGSCGSCWAFSAVGSLEGQLKKKTGTLMSLSTQNLMDCSSKYGNHGCEGGFMANAFLYVMKNGIASEKAYPYEGKVGSCRYKAAKKVAGCTGYRFLPRGDEGALQRAVAFIGPISVAIDASRHKFSFYRHGVYVDNTCTWYTNHGVLVVGYGTEGGQDYWLVKNSWSERYGDKGYVKMARNRKNQCGIARFACYPKM